MSHAYRDTVAFVLAQERAHVLTPSAKEAWLQQFWLNVLARLRQGELVAYGRLIDGSGVPASVEPIARDLLDDAEPDFQRNRLNCGGVMFGSVRIFAVAEPAHSPSAQSRKEVAAVARTGIGGRPSSKHLLIAEMERRALAGELLPVKLAEAEALVRWLTREHPSEPRPQAKSLAEAITEQYRKLKTSSRKPNTSG